MNVIEVRIYMLLDNWTTKKEYYGMMLKEK